MWLKLPHEEREPPSPSLPACCCSILSSGDVSLQFQGLAAWPSVGFMLCLCLCFGLGVSWCAYVCVCACTHVCERWTTVEADVKRDRFMVGDRGREIHRSAVGARKRPEPFLHVLDGAWPQLPSVLRSRLFSVLHTGSLAYLVRHRIWEEERGNLPGLATPHLLREASHHISLETQ